MELSSKLWLNRHFSPGSLSKTVLYYCRRKAKELWDVRTTDRNSWGRFISAGETRFHLKLMCGRPHRNTPRLTRVHGEGMIQRVPDKRLRAELILSRLTDRALNSLFCPRDLLQQSAEVFTFFFFKHESYSIIKEKNQNKAQLSRY